MATMIKVTADHSMLVIFEDGTRLGVEAGEVFDFPLDSLDPAHPTLHAADDKGKKAIEKVAAERAKALAAALETPTAASAASQIDAIVADAEAQIDQVAATVDAAQLPASDTSATGGEGK